MPKVRRLEVKNWERECPECGYQNGFHISLRRISAPEDTNEVEVRLLCPSCSTAFDLGLRARLVPPS